MEIPSNTNKKSIKSSGLMKCTLKNNKKNKYSLL